MPIQDFTQAEMQERFHYDPETGDLTHKKGRFKGKVAGSVLEQNGGYRYLCLGKGGKQHSLLAHRVIWLLVHGEVPPEGMEIDHIDGNPENNRIDNLRVVSHTENASEGSLRTIQTSS